MSPYDYHGAIQVFKVTMPLLTKIPLSFSFNPSNYPVASSYPKSIVISKCVTVLYFVFSHVYLIDYLVFGVRKHHP